MSNEVDLTRCQMLTAANIALELVSIDSRKSLCNYRVIIKIAFCFHAGAWVMVETTTSAKLSDEELLRMTADVVAAYLSNNALPTQQVGEIISSVYASLRSLDSRAEAKSEPLKPAVAIRKSITPDYLVCLEDGKKLKMLKRHLRSTYNLTPDEYRVKWGLAPDYPMVAPKYAQQRSEFAKKIGLGRGTGRHSARGSAKK